MSTRTVEAICPKGEQHALDSELQQAKAGDGASFDRIVGVLSPQLICWLRKRLCRDEDAAASVMQDVWIAAWIKLQAFNSGSHLRQWLFRVARNVAVSRIRRSCAQVKALRVLQRRVDEAVPARGTSAAAEVPHEPLNSLPAPYRAVSVLYYVHGRSTGEIASLLGLTRPNVKMRLLRARHRLRALLKA